MVQSGPVRTRCMKDIKGKSRVTVNRDHRCPASVLYR